MSNKSTAARSESASIFITRRQFGLGVAAAFAGLTIRFNVAEAQPAASTPDLPIMIRNNPNLNAWIRIAQIGRAHV